MKISMHTMAVDQASPMLANISSCLDKGVAYAEAKKFDPSVLVDCAARAGHAAAHAPGADRDATW